MLALFLCLSVPPVPTTLAPGTYNFYKLSAEQARNLVGLPATYRIALASEDWEWNGSRVFEVFMKPGMFGTVWLRPGEDEDGADELTVSGYLRIIRQTDMRGGVFMEYRIDRAVIVGR